VAVGILDQVSSSKPALSSGTNDSSGPIGVVSLAIFLLSWPKPEDMPYVRVRSWKSFDYFGTLLIIAAAVLVVYAFQNAGESFYEVWNTAIFIAPLAAGVICWAGVFVWSYMLDKGVFGKGFAPAFPFRLLRNRHYSAAAISTLLMGYPFLLLIFSFPMRAQVVSGKSALVSGLMLLPMLGTSALASAISGVVNSKKNFLFETMATGASLMVLGCGLLTTVHGSEDDSKAMGFLAFTGLGFGLATASATMLVSFEAPLADAGKFASCRNYNINTDATQPRLMVSWHKCEFSVAVLASLLHLFCSAMPSKTLAANYLPKA
jgi:hypothetical protein